MEDIVRETRRAGEVHLQALVMEVLRPQEDQYTLGSQLVLAQLDAGVFNVLGELSENKFPVARWRGEGLHLLYRVIGFMLTGDQLEDIGAVQLLPDLIKRLREV